MTKALTYRLWKVADNNYYFTLYTYTYESVYLTEKIFTHSIIVICTFFLLKNNINKQYLFIIIRQILFGFNSMNLYTKIIYPIIY